MQLVVDEDNVSLCNIQTGAKLTTHDLSRIRLWGTGKETDSPIFAYVTRDDPKKPFICRVVSCKDCPGQQISSKVQALCNTKLQNLLQASQTRMAAEKSDEPVISMQCQYVGHISIPENAGKDDLKKAVESKCSSSRDTWTKVTMEISSAALQVKDHKNPAIILVDCPVENLKLYGVYAANNKFASIHVQKSPSDCQSHVFYCEPSADHWIKNIHAVCKPLNAGAKGSMLKKLQKLFVGAKRREDR
jgi:hypothetical protein